MLNFLVPETITSISIQDFLRRHMGLSLTVWRKIKHSGTLVVNDKAASIHQVVFPGDVITADWSQECSIIPTELPLNICYEDDHLLIIDKPAGMLVHPTTSEHFATLGNALMYYYHVKQVSYNFHPIHRLDRNTSGLVLIAKYPHIQHLLSHNNIKNIHRQYLAITTGIVTPGEGTIDAPIARHPSSIIERMVDENGQSAITNYKVVKHLNHASLVEVTLLTGRTHQIRVHFSYIGHPLLGDDLYGGSRERIGRQALHAAELIFTHPITGKEIHVESPLPTDIREIMTSLTPV